MQKLKKIVRYIFGIIVVLLVSLCLYVFASTTLLKKDYVNIFGYSFFITSSSSMTGTIEVNDIVIVKINDEFDVNDIITYKDKSGKIITHRLITDNKGKYITKGDANKAFDTPISKKQIIGKVKMIISPIFIIECIVVILILFILVSLINFDNLIKKYIKKEENNIGVPDYLFVNPKKRYEEPSSGMTVTISIEEMEKINKMNEDEAKKEDEIEVLDLVESLFPEDDLNNKDKIKDMEDVDFILSILKCKNDLTHTKMNKKWLTKYQYVYKLCQYLLVKNYDSFSYEVFNPTFKEIYDYDLDRMGLTEVVRNKIYAMPVYTILKILTYCILYNDDEMFDGIYKIMKYKVEIDKDNNYRQLSKNNKEANKQLKILVSFMKKISVKFDKKHVFDLEKIERIVKISNY